MKSDPIIFIDIDDTIRSTKTGKVPVSVYQALTKLRKNGYTMCIATGRNFGMIPQEIKDLHPWDYFICCNGHVINNAGGDTVFKKLFPKEVIRECIRISEETGITLELKTEEERFILKPLNGQMKETFGYFGTLVPKVQPYTDQEVINMLIFTEYGTRAAGFDDYDAIETLYGEAGYCDISLKGYDKVSGIEKILSMTGYHNFTAIGDSFNDKKMIEKAALGIAMGNARPDIQNIADFVTDTVENDGLKKAIDYILKNGGNHES